MYSYEDRIRAVELCIKLGKRVAETIHQLGYPTENALKSWHRAYEQGSDLLRGYARTKPKYSPAQQTLAIEHYVANGRCIAATPKTLGYPSRDSLHAWIQAVHPRSCSPGVARPDTSPRPPELKRLQSEQVAELPAALRDLDVATAEARARAHASETWARACAGFDEKARAIASICSEGHGCGCEVKAQGSAL